MIKVVNQNLLNRSGGLVEMAMPLQEEEVVMGDGGCIL